MEKLPMAHTRLTTFIALIALLTLATPSWASYKITVKNNCDKKVCTIITAEKETIPVISFIFGSTMHMWGLNTGESYSCLDIGKSATNTTRGWFWYPVGGFTRNEKVDEYVFNKAFPEEGMPGDRNIYIGKDSSGKCYFRE